MNERKRPQGGPGEVVPTTTSSSSPNHLITTHTLLGHMTSSLVPVSSDNDDGCFTANALGFTAKLIRAEGFEVQLLYPNTTNQSFR